MLGTRRPLGVATRRPLGVATRRPLGVATLLTVAVFAAGCGGGGTKTAASSATSTTVGGQTRQSFTKCMQSHGVDVSGLRGARGGPTPSSLPPGVTAQQYQAAFSTCRSQLPNGGNFRNNPAFAAYRNCLQLHGVTLPTAGQGAAGGGTSGLDRTNPTVKAALSACAALRPAGGPGSSSTTSTT